MKLIPRRQRDELSSLRTEFDDMLGRFFGDTSESMLPAMLRRNGNPLPPLNVSETEKSWNISLDVPGLTEKDIQVELRGRTLVLSGERKWEEEKKEYLGAHGSGADRRLRRHPGQRLELSPPGRVLQRSLQRRGRNPGRSAAPPEPAGARARPFAAL